MTVLIWIFKNKKALVVKLDSKLITVLHRWEYIPITFIEQTESRRELSSHGADISRHASNRTYSQSYDITYNQDIDEDVHVHFTPIIDGQNFNFKSPCNYIQINETINIIGVLIDSKYNWLIGHVMSPCELIMPNNVISINNCSPLVIRYIF